MDASDDLLIGVDVGTSSIRAAGFDRAGRSLAGAAVPTPVVALENGGAEHDPDALVDAACEVVRRVTDDLRSGDRIRGIAFAAFGETVIAIDDLGRPLGPALAWYDPRPAAASGRIAASVGTSRIAAITGLRAEATYGLAKIDWMRTRYPGRTRCWLNVADWLAYRLSGRIATDMASAGRTMALDLQAQRWSSEMLAAVGLDDSAMPPIHASGTSLGRVRADMAARFGLPSDCVVGVGGYDRAIGALGAGVGEAGSVLDSLGTAEGLLAFLDPLPSPVASTARGFNLGLMPSSDGPKRFLFGGLPTSGAVTAWLGMFLGGLHEDEVSALAETVAPDIAGPLFIPTLRLASAPEPDALARGAFLGIGTSTTAAQLARAVLEGLAMEAARILDLMSAAAPSATVGRIVAVGGGTRNRLLMRLKANCFGRTVEIPGADETSALGAAVCAAVAAGTHPDMAAAMAAMCARPGRQIEAEPELSGFYRHRMENLHTPLTRVLVQDVNPVLLDPVPSGSDRA